MKKIILIVAVVVVALVGLTSYSGTTKKNNDGNLIAELKSGGNGQVIGNGGVKKD